MKGLFYGTREKVYKSLGNLFLSPDFAFPNKGDVVGFLPLESGIINGHSGRIKIFRVIQDAQATDVHFGGRSLRQSVNQPWQVRKLEDFESHAKVLLANGKRLGTIENPRHEFGVAIAYEIL